MRRTSNTLSCLALSALAFTNTGCLEQCVTAPIQPIRHISLEDGVENVDLLFEIDNSTSMSQNQAALSRTFASLIEQLVNPPINPATGRPDHVPVKSLHVGVISSDLGTPGSVVPSCANSDVGDDGMLNPIRNGLAMRTHEPWTTAPVGVRPTRCAFDRDQYPSFLSFSANMTDAAVFRDDLVCNAYLSTGGCGLEQQLEAAYRALVIHNAREQPGNTDPNAGFVRENAALSIVLFTDEEDGSTRDCRYAETGVACTDAVGVFDIMSPDWSSSDLNLRFYMYTPGSRQDPTWPIDRYIDTTHPTRGFTGLKPRHPELVTFSAITGVPLVLPMRASTVPGGVTVDWERLLGRSADGSDGFTGEQTGSGSISMRQANPDPMCSTRVVPACRREDSAATSACDTSAQYFAWPARRIVEVARRFDDQYHAGSVSSICANDLMPAITQVGALIQSRLGAACLPSWLSTTPAICAAGQTPAINHCGVAGTPTRLNCVMREYLPEGVTAASACTRERARTPGARDENTRRETCLVDQITVPLGGEPPAGAQGFWYDTRPDPASPGCSRTVRLTPDFSRTTGATSVFECTDSTAAPAVPGWSGSCG